MKTMPLSRSLSILMAFAALAAAGCAGHPTAADTADSMSCWNVSIEGAAPKTVCQTAAQWEQFLASAGVQCKEGPAVRGMCPEFWKARELGRGLTASNMGAGNLGGDGARSNFVQFYTPTNPDMPNPQNAGNSR
jgi:hypothetical protein